MRIILEVALVVLLMVLASPLELPRLILLALGLVTLYFYATNNAFKDGYEWAEENRVY